MLIRLVRLVQIAAAVAVLLAAVAAAGCSRSSDHSQPGANSAAHNRADVVFAVNMIPHHQEGLDLSALVPDHSTNPQLIKLASGIAAAQGPQIQKLKGFIVQWSEEADSHTGGHADMMMHGMVDQVTMTKLASLKGGEFDTLWLQSMIGHHRGAVEMARAEIDNGSNAGAVTMAHNIVTTQQAEIDQMTKMLGG
jgi:uncharacterized protein (DUF305 family)